MSDYNDANIVMFPSGRKASKLYSQKPLDASADFTVVRGTVANEINSNGLVSEVADNVPRLDYDNTATCPSLLLELSRENEQTASSNFNNGFWSKVAGSTVTINSITAPDGTLTGNKITRGSNDLILRTSSLTIIPSGLFYTYSVYAKEGNITSMSLDIKDEGEVNFTLTDEWQRIEISVTPSADGFVDISFPSSSAGEYVYLWGGQLEAGGFASTLITTTTTAVTRALDKVSKSGISSILNDTEGVLFAEIQALNVNSDDSPVSISSGLDYNNRILFYTSASNYIYVFCFSGGVNSFSFGINTVNVLNFNKIALKYKSGDYAFWINGVEVATGTGVDTPIGLDVLAFDQGFGGGYFNGRCKSLQYYNTILTDTELATLTT